MTEELDFVFDEFKSCNQKTISHLEIELTKVRAGKATPAMLNGVMVEYYGSMTPLQQVANVLLRMLGPSFFNHGRNPC